MYWLIHYPNLSKHKNAHFFRENIRLIVSFCDINIEMMTESPNSNDLPWRWNSFFAEIRFQVSTLGLSRMPSTHGELFRWRSFDFNPCIRILIVETKKVFL